jgi:hypothetical protein
VLNSYVHAPRDCLSGIYRFKLARVGRCRTRIKHVSPSIEAFIL